MKGRMTRRWAMATVLGLAGLAAATPRGWSTDYAGTVQSARAAGQVVLVAVVDTANAYGSRAFMRNILEDAGWAAWRVDNKDSLSLVWWDRAEISPKLWASVAFTFAPEPGEEATLSLPLIAVLSPDGRLADRLTSDDEDLASFDDFSARVDAVLEDWVDLPSGPLAWPAVTTGAGTPRIWSLDYQRSRDAGFRQQVPVLVAIVDSKTSPAATETWVRGVLMSTTWKEWLAENKLLLVWWDRGKISRSKWDDVAFRFAEGDGTLRLPQMVLFDPDGGKADQFLAVKGAEGNYARADDFIDRLDEYLSEWDGVQTGPGVIGFTSSAVTTGAGAASAEVAVQRSGGDSRGAQVFLLQTVSTTNANAAVVGIDYGLTVTNLVWADGESGVKTVSIPLLGGGLGWGTTVSQRVFQVTLSKTTHATASVGTTNLTVTITNGLSAVQTGPGMIGFTTPAVTTRAGVASVAVTVQRSGGSDGTQEFRLSTVSITNANAAITNTHYMSVATNVAWAANESGVKTVTIPLVGNGLDWGTTASQRVFKVVLAKATNATASVGVATQTVTIANSFSVTGGWTYDASTNIWRVTALTNSPATLTWTAPQAGLLTFSGALFGGGQLSVTAAGVPLAVTNGTWVPVSPPVTNGVAVAEGASVVWTASNCTAVVALFAWSPQASAPPSPQAQKAVGTSSTTLNLPPLAWVAPADAADKTQTSSNGARAQKALALLALKDVAPGAFQGMLLDEVDTVRGALALKMSASGALSAKVEAGGTRSRTLRGEWLADTGTAHTARFRDGRDEVLEVTLTAEGVEGRAGGGWTVSARRVPGPAEVAPFAGYYTAVLHAETAEAVAGGKGFLTFTVAPRTGSVKYSGRLADGTSVSGATKLMPGVEQVGAVQFPLYKGLYARRGAVSGLVTLSPGGQAALSQGAWICPATAGDSFSADVTGVGTIYAKPVELSGLDGAVLSVAGVPMAEVSVAGNRPTVVGDGVTLRIAAQTGLFSGSFRDEMGVRRPFKGVLTPSLAYGAGFWLWSDLGLAGQRIGRTSPVEIEGGQTIP